MTCGFATSPRAPEMRLYANSNFTICYDWELNNTQLVFDWACWLWKHERRQHQRDAVPNGQGIATMMRLRRPSRWAASCSIISTPIPLSRAFTLRDLRRFDGNA